MALLEYHYRPVHPRELDHTRAIAQNPGTVLLIALLFLVDSVGLSAGALAIFAVVHLSEIQFGLYSGTAPLFVILFLTVSLHLSD